MEPTSQKQYQQREHRFSVGELNDVEISVQRSEEDGGEECTAQLLDFSRKGVKLLLPISVRFEETIKLDLELKDSEVIYSGLAQIRHIRADGEKGWQVGCSVQPSINDEVISHLASSSGKERRRHERIPVSGQGTLQRQGETEATTVQLQNLSEGGFCLAVPNHHTVGERVKLEIPNWEDELQTIDGEIRWQVSTLVGYFVGCSFAHAEGFEKLASCVVESRPKSISISRFMMTASIITMLIPSVGYLWMHKPSPVAVANSIQHAEIDLDDPKPTFIPEWDRPLDTDADKGQDLPKTDNPIASTTANGTAQGTETTGLAADPDPENNLVKKPVADGFVNQSDPISQSSNNDKVENPQSIFDLLNLARRFPVNQPAETTTTAKKPLMGVDEELETSKAMAPMRMWTDDTGDYRIEAALIKINKDAVVLRSFDDSLMEVPLSRLCDKDRKYLLRWTDDEFFDKNGND